MSMLTLSSLRVYPVKSMRGHEVAQAEVGACGFTDDRRFMVVGSDGRFLTQRTRPALARVVPSFEGESLVLRVGERAPLEVARRPDGPRREVEVWRDRVQAISTGSEAAAWLSDVLGEPAELVWMPDDVVRAVDADYAPEGGQVSFADGYPFLLASTASLAELARRGVDVPMTRFRPNLVVDGAAPFAEDQWKAVRVGGVRFRLVKPCARCVVTTTDQESGVVTGPEPLRTLATFRKQESGVMFAVNVVHEGRGLLRRGDAVEIEL